MMNNNENERNQRNDEVEMAHRPFLKLLNYSRDREIYLEKVHSFLTNDRYSDEAKEYVYNQLSTKDQFVFDMEFSVNGNFIRDNPEMAQSAGLRIFGFTEKEENNLNEIYSTLVELSDRPRARGIIYNTLSERERLGIDILARQNQQNQEVVNDQGQNNAVQNNQPEQNNEGENIQPEQNNNAGQDVLPRRNNQLVQSNSRGQINQQTYLDSNYTTTISSVHSDSSDSPSQHMNRGRK